jgi:hypothetical protein
VKFIIMQFSPWSVFLPFRSKYPQHSVLVTKAWRVLRLRMKGRPLDTEGSCEYIE